MPGSCVTHHSQAARGHDVQALFAAPHACCCMAAGASHGTAPAHVHGQTPATSRRQQPASQVPCAFPSRNAQPTYADASAPQLSVRLRSQALDVEQWVGLAHRRVHCHGHRVVDGLHDERYGRQACHHGHGARRNQPPQQRLLAWGALGDAPLGSVHHLMDDRAGNQHRRQRLPDEAVERSDDNGRRQPPALRHERSSALVQYVAGDIAKRQRVRRSQQGGQHVAERLAYLVGVAQVAQRSVAP
mmetsp:Transcript_1022/g.2779  ORF Transcript_1022/g.2779 Transcript_1022/m.2779 type:complete len:244 (+) Transcript_1022:517-1248(+)